MGRCQAGRPGTSLHGSAARDVESTCCPGRREVAIGGDESTSPAIISFLSFVNTNLVQCMEKGLKNLTQAYRSAQKKLENGTYHDHEDSGIGISDLEEEQEDHRVDMPAMPTLPESHYYSGGYPSQQQQQQQRVPSIQSMLHPMQHQHQHPHPHTMQQAMQQPIQQPLQQSMQQTMPQNMQYASHHLSHQQ